MIKKIILSTIIFLFILNVGFSQGLAGLVKNQKSEEPVSWKQSFNKISESEYELVFTATAGKGYHFYSQYTQGTMPMAISFDEPKGYKAVGKMSESPKPKEEYDETLGGLTKYWDKTATFKQKIKITSAKPVKIHGYMDGQACITGACTVVSYEFKFEFEGTTAIEKAGSDSTDNNVNETITNDTNTKIQSATNSDNIQPIVKESKKESNENEGSLWSIILEAILWGFAALLTPCVFPMVPMTVSFFMKGSENKIKARFNALTYGISIVTLYTLPIALIILITYMFGGESVTGDIFNWISTHWLPNIIFFLIFMIFAASFFGAFEIVLPSWMVNKADANADKGGMIGAFFMALTLVIVSFSCTGPIVGSVIIKSTQGEIWEPVVTMFAFSAAFALPFTLFAFFPSLLSKMPKSGGWLNSVKVVLGFVEVALGLKFLSVADQTYHWGILDREVYLAIWIVTFALMGFYLLGKLKFSHDSEVKHISVGRLFLSIIVFSFVMYMIPGMWGAPLKALSGYMPPIETLDWTANNTEAKTIVDQSTNSLCESPKYSNILHLPHNIQGYFDLEQALNCAKEQNKPVFVDFTGHGCVNCREMEANVWSDPAVLKMLKENFIVVALYVDDKLTLPENEWLQKNQSKDGRIKKTIGEKNADLQIQEFNQNSQPLYVILDKNTNPKDIKPEDVLTKPHAYNKDVSLFVNFLQNGLKNFAEKNK